MNFLEALKAARLGKKIKPISWTSEHYLELNCGRLINENRSEYLLSYEDITQIDWQIVSEPKTVLVSEGSVVLNREMLEKAWDKTMESKPVAYQSLESWMFEKLCQELGL